MIRKTLSAVALALPVAFGAGDALAQAAEPWRFEASIYGYFPDVGGRTTFPQSSPGTDIGVDASTLIENLNGVFMGSFEAQKGRWGLFTDLIYLNLGDSRSGTREFTIGGAALPAGAAANASFDLTGWSWTLAASYRLWTDGSSKMELLAGARMLDIEQKLDWQITGNVGPIPVPGRAGQLRAELTNWDAIVGIKGRLALGGGKWFVPYYLDVGTGDSESTWQAVAGLGYSFGWGDVVGSWRYLDYQMKSGRNLQELNFSGPQISAVFHW